jgi:two-component system response regulator
MEAQEVEILLIEDNRTDAEMTIRALRKNKIVNKVVHVNDGAVALEFLYGTGIYADRNLTYMPRLILLDVKMPKVSGIEVLKVLKENPTTRKIPVVMLTSSREDPDIDTCYQLGVNSYIVKPVEFEDFMKVVSELGIYWMMHNEPQKKLSS